MEKRNVSLLAQRYVDGELHPSQEKLVQKKLKEDPEFRKEVEFHQQLNKAIKLAPMQEQLNAIHGELFGNYARQLERLERFGRRMIGAAAVAAIAIVLTGTTLRAEKLTPIEAYNKYYEKPAIEAVYRSDRVQAIDMHAIGANYFFGVRQLEAGNTEAAAKLFKQAIFAESLFSDSARWMLTMSYLKEGCRGSALQQLNYLVQDESSFYQKKAETLIRKLS